MSIVDGAHRHHRRQAVRRARLARAQRSRRRTEVRRASNGRPPVCASATTARHPRHVPARPAGFTRGRAVAGPPLFVPSTARNEMTGDGYRLLVQPPALRRSIGAAGIAARRRNASSPSGLGSEPAIFVVTLSSETTVDPFLIGNDW
ncbi:hypothetical protein [Burkholderia anthina]|uniref:hypothetical protein n=1 Tax=Burkholderia anthina TaxID=179879 RepID=UPI001AA07BF5|nr:hypothetical protein [Burkholderia anthina]QTD92862.1 hypothetical protein J4G50_32185 [Burkholderia anthina]